MATQESRSYDIKAILEEMREAYWQGIEQSDQTTAAETRDYVVFRLGGERFGVPTVCAREVLRLPRLVRVPRLPAHICGIVNLRGQIHAVTDLRPLLGLPTKELSPRSQLIVVEAAGVTTALVTEGVEGMRALAIAEIEPITEGLAGFPRDAAEGHVVTEEGLLVLLSLEHILGRAEFIINQKGE